MGELTGRIALVTGASRGIGAATARALAAAGAKVAVTDLKAPDELAVEIGGIARAQDVTSEADWSATMDWIESTADGLDILVNNAGLFLMKPLVETTLGEWRRLHAVNVEGVFLGTRAAIPLLAAGAKKMDRWNIDREPFFDGRSGGIRGNRLLQCVEGRGETVHQRGSA